MSLLVDLNRSQKKIYTQRLNENCRNLLVFGIQLVRFTFQATRNSSSIPKSQEFIEMNTVSSEIS